MFVQNKLLTLFFKFYSRVISLPSEIKNGLLVSGKYRGQVKCLGSPKVAVFSNTYPDMINLSRDRWQVVWLGEGEYGDLRKNAIISPGEIYPFATPPPMPDLSEDFNLVDFLTQHQGAELRAPSAGAGTSGARAATTPPRANVEEEQHQANAAPVRMSGARAATQPRSDSQEGRQVEVPPSQHFLYLSSSPSIGSVTAVEGPQHSPAPGSSQRCPVHGRGKIYERYAASVYDLCFFTSINLFHGFLFSYLKFIIVAGETRDKVCCCITLATTPSSQTREHPVRRCELFILTLMFYY